MRSWLVFLLFLLFFLLWFSSLLVFVFYFFKISHPDNKLVLSLACTYNLHISICSHLAGVVPRQVNVLRTCALLYKICTAECQN